ncbi:hypothetical protein HK098_000922 [Nowakowskiella sp. JEL0407]|nr:hypothetical protein HK098_000922 [Nowakowskiella sp. JEL0407]
MEEKLRTFLETNGIDPKEYEYPLNYRYFRIPHVHVKNADRIISQMKQDLSVDSEQVCIELVEWFPISLARFYKVGKDLKLSHTKAYKSGEIHCMDISSAVPLFSLELQASDNYLELCCAPGSKLCLAYDIITSRTNHPDETQQKSTGTVTGVDISQPRLQVAKSQMKKFKVEKGRLFCSDAATFSVSAPSRLGSWTNPLVSTSITPQKRTHSTTITTSTDNDNKDSQTTLPYTPNPTKIAPYFATKLLRNDPQLIATASPLGGDKTEPSEFTKKNAGSLPFLLYDKVLVDAECTHDASISNMQRGEKEGWNEKFLDEERVAGLESLQRNLIENGFKLLAKNGILVYSTCSFSTRQNEDIVIWLLSKYKDSAVIETIPGVSEFPCRNGNAAVNSNHREADDEIVHDEAVSSIREEVFKKILNFSPSVSETSGMFIARIRKTQNII